MLWPHTNTHTLSSVLPFSFSLTHTLPETDLQEAKCTGCGCHGVKHENPRPVHEEEEEKEEEECEEEKEEEGEEEEGDTKEKEEEEDCGGGGLIQQTWCRARRFEVGTVQYRRRGGGDM